MKDGVEEAGKISDYAHVHGISTMHVSSMSERPPPPRPRSGQTTTLCIAGRAARRSVFAGMETRGKGEEGVKPRGPRTRSFDIRQSGHRNLA